MVNPINIEEVIQIIDSYDIRIFPREAGRYAFCQIGACEFPLTAIPDNIALEDYATDELAEFIVSAINRPTSLSAEEAEYCKTVIREINKGNIAE